MTARPHAICLACGERRLVEHYLCRGCWFQLPVETRRRLWRRDAGARDRLFQLFSAIRRGVPLARIAVGA